MLRVVFPTNQKISYMSPIESSFEDANYLTILDLVGQNISAVNIMKNPHPHTEEEILKECKDMHFGVLILPDGKNMPIKKLKKNGTVVFKSDENKMILNAVSDFIQDKLEKVK
jgi:predicted Fe-Mo cluster-binding NifX family protein